MNEVLGHGVDEPTSEQDFDVYPVPTDRNWSTAAAFLRRQADETSQLVVERAYGISGRDAVLELQQAVNAQDIFLLRNAFNRLTKEIGDFSTARIIVQIFGTRVLNVVDFETRARLQFSTRDTSSQSPFVRTGEYEAVA